jgi:hypothetical protein
VTTKKTRAEPEAGPAEPTDQRGDSAERRSDALPGVAAESLGVAVEAILRQVATLKAASAEDDQLTQLIRMVDSATWSAPLPMTVLVDGALLRGVLVPSEVNAAYLDDALSHSAHSAITKLEEEEGFPAAETTDSGPDAERKKVMFEQARAFLQRTKRHPFSAAQARMRQRNASALVALDRWHQDRGSGSEARPAPLDAPGTYTDPASTARSIIPYTVGQRALTLADVRMLVAGEWLAFSAPVRVTVGRIGAWAIDQ